MKKAKLAENREGTFGMEGGTWKANKARLAESGDGASGMEGGTWKVKKARLAESGEGASGMDRRGRRNGRTCRKGGAGRKGGDFRPAWTELQTGMAGLRICGKNADGAAFLHLWQKNMQKAAFERHKSVDTVSALVQNLEPHKDCRKNGGMQCRRAAVPASAPPGRKAADGTAWRRNSNQQDAGKAGYFAATSMETEFQQEHWRILKSHPRYAVSDLGRIKLLAERESASDRILTPYMASSHGVAVRIRRSDGSTWKPMIRLLVAEAWLPPKSGKQWLHHVNGDFMDCRACNLEWRDAPPAWFGRPKGAVKAAPEDAAEAAAALGCPPEAVAAAMAKRRRGAE